MIYLLVLSGGYGKRLFPLSTTDLPKQFIKPTNSHSFFQKTILRHNFEPIVLTNSRYSEVAYKQLIEINAKKYRIILEQQKLGTALSIAIGSSIVKSNDILLVTPSDSYISNQLNYLDNINNAIELSIKHNKLVSLVVEAQDSCSPYGYVRLNTDNINCIDEFIEKPKLLLDNKNYYWNTGIFICQAQKYLQLTSKAKHNLSHKARQLLLESHSDNHQHKLSIPSPTFNTSELSVDKLIMEKTQGNYAIIGDFEWMDMGSWNSLYKLTLKNNYLMSWETDYNELLMQEVIPNKLTLVTIRKKAFLIYNNITQHIVNYVSKQWGKYFVLYYEKPILIKYLIFDAKQSTSLQKHHYRSEYWFIISGRANIIINNTKLVGEKGDTFSIPTGHTHKITNIGNDSLHLIEIQQGEILSEKDIVRLQPPEFLNSCSLTY